MGKIKIIKGDITKLTKGYNLPVLWSILSVLFILNLLHWSRGTSYFLLRKFFESCKRKMAENNCFSSNFCQCLRISAARCYKGGNRDYETASGWFWWDYAGLVWGTGVWFCGRKLFRIFLRIKNIPKIPNV